MPCSWQKEDYFSLLMSTDKKSFSALEMLVDDLHADKEKTVNKFLCHSGSEDFLWGLVRLLGNDTARVAGNAAYILGTLAESEIGCARVLSLVNSRSTESKKILPNLTRMLTFDDSESVMNAAGTMGTLAESHEGREWILSEPCLPQTLEHITALLHSENLWTASNAALVLARLSISEMGCTRILEHEHSTHILSKLILSLGVDEAGRGMNAAFAIGRLCDLDQGRKRLLQLSDSERMISSLAKMLSCDDTGASKNACFALSCLATNVEGHSRLLGNTHSEEILKTLATLLNAQDSETGWFAAMTLRTLASQPKGCLRLREHPQVISGLKSIEVKEDVNPDLKEEAIITLEILKRLPKPSPPVILTISSNSIHVTWDPIVTKSGFQVRYQLFDSTKCVYTGKQCECDVVGLLPNTVYVYKLRAYTEGDESPFSDCVSIITEESVPGPPQSVRVLGTTITQLKIGWDSPSEINGTLKGYYIFLDDKEVQHTLENTIILTSLSPNTSYEVEVCAATSKGRGEKAGCSAVTAEMGAHAPSKPHINVVGRNELYVSWGPPEVPLGRLNRYDVIMNDKIIYSGNDLNLPVRRLTPDTEYSFVIVALTSDGKFESKIAKKRTAKDEYDPARAPLYQTPKKEVPEEGLKLPQSTPTTQKKRKSSAGRISSAKQSSKRAGTGKERVKSSSAPVDPRPSSVASSITSIKEVPSPRVPLEKQEKPQSESPPTSVEQSPVQSTTPSLAGRPVAEIKIESPVKPRTPRLHHKMDRSATSLSIQQRVALSTVSMQNSAKPDNSADTSKPLESSISTKKLGNKETPIINNLTKIERSKTSLNSTRKGKYSSSPIQKSESETKLLFTSSLGQDISEGTKVEERSRPNTNDRDQNFSVNSYQKSKLEFETSNSANPVIKISETPTHLNKAERERTREKSNKGQANGNRSSSERLRGSRDTVLPKPLPPSQQYLLEPGQGQIEASWKEKIAASHKTAKDVLDSDWLTQVKSVSESYSRPFANNPTFTETADSTYYIDQSQLFLQRTNTYMNSHSRHNTLAPLQRKSTEPLARQTLPHNAPLTPIRENSNKSEIRPTVGRRSLEKLQKSTSNSKVSFPTKTGQFDIDIIQEPSSSKLANKFIPMQLRTQPSNLGLGHLQRVNTTLLSDVAGNNSISFRRVEAMTRSQTLMDMRHSNPGVQANSSIPAENRRDLMVPVKERESSRGRRASGGSPSKVHKLGESPSGRAQRMGEPDSVLLQQSWGFNSAPDIGALQNVR
ncbi:uncharacterized protein LOC127833449 isoform X2 [Dreissena polymorpha]|uniref:uncharacterized protein LOC127833449 isoform X2 n=1 Tax=Dreissena polymorpha TaxID=45954 RepID=UPI002263C5AD|nr:uncharacterized protein LOC127833449 isoform X2 [Dreissena polymorpha]